jgi:hypothetical protein
MAFHWENNLEYARYIDENRQNIEVMYIVDDPAEFANPDNPHGREAKLHVLPADENDAQFKALLEKFSYDEIMEMTYVYNKNAEKAFEEQVLAIARKTGKLNLEGVEVVSEEFVSKFIDIMFLEKGIAENEIKELLFKTKLRLFELDQVKKSKNRDLKSKLRKAKTLKEVFAYMLEFDEEAK